MLVDNWKRQEATGKDNVSVNPVRYRMYWNILPVEKRMGHNKIRNMPSKIK